MSRRARGPGGGQGDEPPSTVGEPVSGERAEGEWALAGTRREKFAAKVEESLFERGGFKPIEGAPGDENEVGGRGEGLLVGAKSFAQAPFGPGAGDRVADGGARRDKAGAGGWGGRGAGGVGLERDRIAGARGEAGGVIKHKGAAIIAAPVGADVLEIRGATQVLLGAEAHGAGRGGPAV